MIKTASGRRFTVQWADGSISNFEDAFDDVPRHVGDQYKQRVETR